MSKLATAQHFERSKMRTNKEYELRQKIVLEYNPTKGSIDDLITWNDRMNAANLYEQFLQGLFWDMYNSEYIQFEWLTFFKESLINVTYKELHEWQERVKK